MSKALEQLKAQADSYGISYHPSIGEDKLQEKIDAFLKEKAASVDSPAQETTTTKAATPSREELIAEASKLVRVNIACMNPAKKDWDGEIITAGNSLIGTFRKFVKFNTEEGYHVPQVIFNVLKNRKFQTFHNVRTKNGVTQRAARLVPEFSIEVLPQLTEAELAELAKNQAARG